MNNYVPIFEVKDSFIIKHKLNYDTSYNLGEYDNEDNFTSYKQRMIFTDYDLARKTQINNAENFESLIIKNDLNEISVTSEYVIDSLRIEYLDYQYTLLLDGKNVEYENIWKNNVENILRPLKKQNFTISGTTEDINIGDIVTVEIYRIQEETVTLNWEINSVYVGEMFFFDGVTPSGKQWIQKIISAKVGYSSGTEIFIEKNKIPMLKYNSIVLDKNINNIILENKIEMYLFNDFSNYNDLYFKIISNNHCERSYSSILDKLRYFKYYDYFDYKLYTGNNLTDTSDDYLEIIPKLNNENIYFYYDKFIIKMGLLENFEDDGVLVLPLGYSEYNYFNNYAYYRYVFNTNNIYSKYTLELLLQQFDFVGKETEYYIYNILSDGSVVFNYDDNVYLYFTVSNSSIFNKYSFIKLITSNKEYYALIIDKYVDELSGDNILKILKPNNYENELSINDNVIIRNVGTLREISYILDRTFFNYKYLEFNKISIDLQRRIYYFYADIINKLEMNQQIRIALTGIIFQNEKNRMVLKIFDPTDFKDKRLLYEPTELTLIGKDRKTTLPIIIDEVLLGITSDLLDPNKNTKTQIIEKTFSDVVISDKSIKITFDDVSDFVLNKYVILVSDNNYYYQSVISIVGNEVTFDKNESDLITHIDNVFIGFEYGPLYVLSSNEDEILLVIDANLA